MLTPISRARSDASVVFPSPGGPWKRMWSSGSRRCFAASIAMPIASRTLACPMNSPSRVGRSVGSSWTSSTSASGVVICVRSVMGGI